MKHSIKTLLISAMAVFLLLPASAGGMTLEDLQIHGFISQGFLYSTDDVDFLAEDSHEGTFEFNEMAINFSATPTDDLSVGVQLAAFDLGTIGNDEVMGRSAPIIPSFIMTRMTMTAANMPPNTVYRNTIHGSRTPACRPVMIFHPTGVPRSKATSWTALTWPWAPLPASIPGNFTRPS